MPLLKLSGIGKIYYSEGNVAVGIRGIDLSFERGEFVAVTGASGSGKSTLLNVISGMDSYEEGELYIEDEPTSHYLEPDWEEYRSKYISFIFQDYNILESYTVLQNVELALMHIKDKRERRRRAVELLTRVGMDKHLRQKGSKLSGGQKQRTVIARALAKDSPIILADEPTGNLDEATSREIIELLREVSKDKLLIVVTHNYEEVQEHATRHIRIFDGAVEFDRGEKPAGEARREEKPVTFSPPKKKRFSFREFMSDLKEGANLGGHVFASRPKLAVFTCLLMAVGILGVFLLTSSCFDSEMLSEFSYKMFRYSEGRAVVVRRDGDIPDEGEIEALAEKYGAEKYVPCDYLYDRSVRLDRELYGVRYDSGYGSMVSVYNGRYFYLNPYVKTLDDFSGRYEGSLPEKDGEVLLRLPISNKEDFSDTVYGKSTVFVGGTMYTVTGIEYYYDNNIPASVYMSKSDFESLSSIAYFSNSQNTFGVRFSDQYGNPYEVTYGKNDYIISAELGDKIYLSKAYLGDLDPAAGITLSVSGMKDGNIHIAAENILSELPESLSGYSDRRAMIIGFDLISDLADGYTGQNYSQFSLIFKNDRQAKRAVDQMLGQGYIAVMSDAEYEPEAFERFAMGFLFFMIFMVWLGGIVCLAFFIRLCQSRSIVSFKNDIAIMRSMGIKASVIKLSMYMRSVIALIPAVIILFIAAVYIFTSPKLNGYFGYLYAWQYALICLGMLLIAFRVSRKQQSKLFAESVKKTLTGGQLND